MQVKQLIHKKIVQENQSGTYQIVDGFPMPICHYACCKQTRSFKGVAGYGYCASKDEKYYGFK